MHYINSKPLSRRTVLQGAGATMALPFMEAMAAPKATGSGPALGAEGQPIRYGAVFIPNGLDLKKFTPSGNTLDELPATLKSLKGLSKKANVVTGLSNSSVSHLAGTAAWLTSGRFKRGSSVANIGNASIDQIIGSHAKGACPIPTLELGLHTPRPGNSGNQPWTYGNFVSWRNGTTPVPHEINPLRAFDRLFKRVKATKSGRPTAPRNPPYEPDKSVVDTVLADAKELQRRLGKSDSDKLDEYLTTVRDVESIIIKSLKVEAQGTGFTREMVNDVKKLGTKVRSVGDVNGISKKVSINHKGHTRMMMDIIALAFWSNTSRTATFMFGDGGSRHNLSFLDGVTGSHHSISHHGNKPGNIAMYHKVNAYMVENYAYLLERLDSMKEGNSTVLDNSMILCGSSMSDGQNHSTKSLPLLIAGSAGGRVKTNRHIKAKGKVGGLHKACLDVMNIKGNEIGGKGISI